MTDDAIVGGVYAYRGGGGKYRVCKVLAVDEFAVHLRQYANRYDEAPKAIPPDLTLSGTTIATVGIGHMPIDKEGFAAEPHDLLGIKSVAQDELDGYYEYLGLTDESDKEPLRISVQIDLTDFVRSTTPDVEPDAPEQA